MLFLIGDNLNNFSFLSFGCAGIVFYGYLLTSIANFLVAHDANIQIEILYM